MALRLQSTFYNVNNLQFDVCIYDEEYVGSVIDFNMDNSQGFTINYQGEGEKLHLPILMSKCEVGMWIDSNDVQTFVDDLNTAYEGQFRLVIKESGVLERWVGVVLPDLIQYQDLPQSVRPSFKLIATDGIKRLQKVAYKNTSAPYSGRESIVQHLTKCISFLNTTDLITYTSYVLVVSNRWTPANIKAGDVLDNTDFEHRALYQVDDRGNYKYTSVYRVIEQLCLRFDCQFKMWNGRYYFTQHNYHSETSWSEYRYTDAGVLTTSGSRNNENTQDSTFSNKFKGGVYSFFPALKFATVNYIHFGYSNITKGYQWSDASTPTVPESPTVYAVANNASFNFSANFFYSFLVSGNRPRYMKFLVTLQVDTNYLKRTSTVTTGSIINQPEEISATAANYELILAVDVNTFVGGVQYAGSTSYPVTFPTIPFPTGGEVLFTISYVESYDASGTVVSSGIDGLNWRFYDVKLTVLPGGELSNYSNTRSVTLANDTTGNSESEIINMSIGDGFGYGRLIIDNGATEEDAASWGVGASAANVSIEELLGTELIKTQSVPIRKFSGEIDMAYNEIGETIVHGSNRWVFYKGKFIADFERVIGEWLLLDTTGTSSSSTEDQMIDEIDGNGNPITPSSPIGDSGTPVVIPDQTGTPDSPGVVSVLDSLFPRTTDDINTGDTVTQIPISARGADGEYKVGQTVTLVNTDTGAQQDFVISQESATGDTFLNVTSDTALFDFPTGSWIVTSQEQTLSGGGSTAFYREEFPTHASATITVTANSGNLPSNAAAIRVYFDNGQLISKNYWSHSGSDITLTYTPNGVQSIWVEFNV